MWGKSNLLAILIGVLFFTGCGIDSLNDPILITDVEDEFYVDMWEELTPSNRTLFFRVRTIENEECLNTSINTVLLKSGTELTLELNGISEPDDCIDGIAPATSEEVVGTLNAGIYKMNVDLQNTVFNEGQLEVNQNRYFLNLDTDNGINIPNKVLLRVPEKSFWGYIDYGPNELDAEALLESIAELSERPSLSIGYYGYFTIINDPNDMIEITDRPNSNRLISFIFTYEDANEEAIKALIEDFRVNNPALGLNIKDYQGQEW